MTSILCVICQDTPDTNAEWSALSCGHVFHRSCVSTWLHQSPCCPQCKQRLSCAPMKIYFATEEDRRQDDFGAAAAMAAAEPEDPQELEQLRQLLFNEVQEKDAAWQQVTETEKLTSRLKSDITDSNREAMRLARELESHQMALVHQHEELEQKERDKMSLMQQLRDSNCLTSQLLDSQEAVQQANCRLVESTEALEQRLRSAEQQNKILRCQIDVLESQHAVSVASVETSQRNLKDAISVLKTELSGCKWQLDLEQKKQSQLNQQLTSLQSHNGQVELQNAVLSNQLTQQQKSYVALKEASNAEVQRYKNLYSEAQQRLDEAERKTRIATERLTQDEELHFEPVGDSFRASRAEMPEQHRAEESAEARWQMIRRSQDPIDPFSFDAERRRNWYQVKSAQVDEVASKRGESGLDNELKNFRGTRMPPLQGFVDRNAAPAFLKLPEHLQPEAELKSPSASISRQFKPRRRTASVDLLDSETTDAAIEKDSVFGKQLLSRSVLDVRAAANHQTDMDLSPQLEADAGSGYKDPAKKGSKAKKNARKCRQM